MKHHPKGLYILFFTELWERFSYYGMRAILVLYVIASAQGQNPGLGWAEEDALKLYGWYTMLVYLMSIPGGILADKLLGQKKMVFIGGLLIIAGQFVLAIDSIIAFYSGLGLIILGVGGLKPNISTMVGGLYKEGDLMRDKGFTIFYIGINIGAATAPLLVGWIGETIGWHIGFSLAGFGMILGQAVYVWGQKYLKGIGDALAPIKDGTTKKNTHAPLTKIEKDRIVVLFISFLIVIMFWGAYEQAGGLLNIYTKEKLNRIVFGWEIPASVFQSLPAIYVILLGTIVATFWVKWQEKGRESSSLFKMAVGIMIMGSGFLFMVCASLDAAASADGKAALYWLFGAYFLHVVGELCASPVALSFITKLAPAKYGSIMMGIYFAMTGLGNKLAGLIGEAAADAGEKTIFFGITFFTVGFGILLLIFLKRLKALTHGAEDIRLQEAA
ncbi:MAG: peptide MFS transporter [Deferribacteres bacterium]|nr:peptide MFS transporter [candidate division KSB1 bacterium]MCB9504419.1 peptide MFS transporter [Deferribacteres bacterium]